MAWSKPVSVFISWLALPLALPGNGLLHLVQREFPARLPLLESGNYSLPE
jgi:hypothetical protein